MLYWFIDNQSGFKLVSPVFPIPGLGTTINIQGHLQNPEEIQHGQKFSHWTISRTNLPSQHHYACIEVPLYARCEIPMSDPELSTGSSTGSNVEWIASLWNFLQLCSLWSPTCQIFSVLKYVPIQDLTWYVVFHPLPVLVWTCWGVMAETRDIVLTGGGPWGFTLSGGKDFGAPLKVSKVSSFVKLHIRSYWLADKRWKPFS